jgi:hypothetical protein
MDQVTVLLLIAKNDVIVQKTIHEHCAGRPPGKRIYRTQRLRATARVGSQPPGSLPANSLYERSLRHA